MRSYFVSVYDTIAQLAAVIRRLSGFTRHMEGASGIEDRVTRETTAGSALVVRDF